MPTTVLFVDDHRLIREGLASYLEGQEEYRLLNEGASNGVEALEMLESQQPDIILTDIKMPHMDGIELTKEIAKKYPKVKIIALSMLNDHVHIKKMINSGALGYLLKNCSQSQLINALDTIKSGDTYYSPEVTDTVMNAMMSGRKHNISQDIPITRREQEVLELIVSEHSNKEIADKLFISLRTVDAHKRNLLEKTGSKNIAGLVVFAINNNLVQS